jgi:hypothetical protein
VNENYPGSQMRRGTPPVQTGIAPTPGKGWDSAPKYLDYKGQTIEAFYRGALAKALNRKVVTIRAMVMKGVMPNPRLKDGHGRWLFTRDQIEDMIALFTEEGILDPRSVNRPPSKHFIEQTHQILSRLPA